MDFLRIVYSEPHCAVAEDVYMRMRVAQEVAVTQLVIAKVRLGVTRIVEQHEGHHPLRILKSEIKIIFQKEFLFSMSVCLCLCLSVCLSLCACVYVSVCACVRACI